MAVLDYVIRFSIIGIAFFLPLSSGAVNTLIGIGIAGWLLRRAFGKKIQIKRTKLNLPLFLFLVVSCVSILNSVEPSTSVKGLIKVLKYMGIYFMMIENIDDLRFVKNVITALILGAVVVCLDGVFQYITGKDLLRSNPLIINVGLRRMTAAYRHCNDFGVYLVTIAGVIWALGLYELRKKAKWFTIMAATLITLCVALTFSRGALLGFYGAAILMTLVKKDKWLLAVLALSLVAMPFLIPSGVKEWGSTTKSFLEFFCNMDRIMFYRTAIEMIKAHPFIGVGINTFVKAYHNYKVPDQGVITGFECYAHNNYLQMAGEIGLIGLAVFFWILAALFLELRGIIQGGQFSLRTVPAEAGYIRNAALGLGCGIFAFLLNGLTESSFYFSKIVVVFWFVMGLAVSLKFVKDENTGS